MFNKLITFFAFILISSACQKPEVFKMPVYEGRNDASYAMTVHMYNRSFLQDFVALADTSVDYTPMLDYVELVKIASRKDKEKLAASYPRMKKEILDLAAENDSGKNHIIQNLTLRYLRNYLLLSENQELKEDTKLFYSVIMKTNPVDLDVLVDTYLEISDMLTEEERLFSLVHFEKLYARFQLEITEKLPIAKDHYFNATTEREQFAAIREGKRLERMSKSCNYSAKKLGLGKS